MSGIKSKMRKEKTIEEENYKRKLDDIEEHYEERLNELLPDYSHRGDITSPNRLLGYFDALMATCATFLIIPIRNLKGKEDETLLEFINDIRLEILMFFLGFLVVLSNWEQIIIRSFFIKRLDDFIVLMATLAVLLVSVLPFSLALMGHYPMESVAVILTCVVLGLFELVDLTVMLYVSYTPRVLHIEMRNWSPKDVRQFCLFASIKSGMNILVVVTVGLLYMWHYATSWIFFGLLVLNPIVRKSIMFLRRRLSTSTNLEKSHFFWNYSKGNIPKERVEVMSDAAVAIIACILILDMIVEEFPKEADVKRQGLVTVLKHMRVDLVVFVAAFGAVSALWYVNHTVLHLFRIMNVVILFLQKFFLAFTCFIPLASNMINKHKKTGDEDEQVSLLFGVVVAFLAGMCNLLMLVYGLATKDKYLHHWAFTNCFKTNLKRHLYVILKTVSIPFWNGIAMVIAIAWPSAASYAIFICRFVMLLTFIVLKLIFMNNFGKKLYTMRNEIVLADIDKRREKEEQTAEIEEVGTTNDAYEKEEQDVDNTAL